MQSPRLVVFDLSICLLGCLFVCLFACLLALFVFVARMNNWCKYGFTMHSISCFGSLVAARPRKLVQFGGIHGGFGLLSPESLLTLILVGLSRNY